MMMENVPVFVTPVPSTESEATSSTVSTNNPWLDRLLKGDSIVSNEWNQFMNNATTVPLLDDVIHPIRSGMVVRFVGMVQDMLETEYFCTTNKSSNSNSAMMMNDNNMNSNIHIKTNLAERTPLIVVPIPTDKKSVVGQKYTGSTKADYYEQQHRDKRLKTNHYNNSSSMECDDNNNNGPPVKTIDYVVAKFYYDQYPSIIKKLKLNEMVEVIAVIGEKSMEDTSPTSFENNMNSNNMMMSWDDAPVIDSNALRLHILCYKVLQVEDLISSSLAIPQNNIITNNFDPSSVLAEMMSSQLGINKEQQHVVGHAIWMWLQSKAERDEKGTPVIVRKQQQGETVLGCASLNMIVSPNDVTSSYSYFKNQLVYMLQKLVPVVQYLQVTPATLEDNLLVPNKQAGRLHQTPLQLPTGSILIVDMTQFNYTGKLSTRQLHNIQLLHKLCNCHLLPYTFDGNVQINFDADYRVLVLSNPQTHNLLPCSFTVQCHTNNQTITTAITSSKDNNNYDNKLKMLQYILSNNRRLIGNINLDKNILEFAQNDFLQRRTRRREQTDENAFHRWLMLTRLYARSRHTMSASIQDWQLSLVLDDAMQVTIH